MYTAVVSELLRVGGGVGSPPFFGGGKMQTNTKEFEDMVHVFKNFYKGHFRLEMERKSMWPHKAFFEDPEANKAFLAFHAGVEYGKALSR